MTNNNSNSERPLLGVILMVLGMMFIPLIDVTAKLLSENLHVLQVAWSRFFVHLLWLLPFVIYGRQKFWRLGDSLWLQLGRGLGLTLATVFFFAGISSNSIPATLALLFISPLVVTLAAPLLLREQFALVRLLAAGVGFIGVLIVLRPQGEFRPSLLFGVLAGISYAGYLLCTRKIAHSVPPLVTMFNVALVGSIALLPTLPLVGSVPSGDDWLLLALMGLAAVIGHYLILYACRLAEASLLAPFTYCEMLGAVFFSYLIFDFWPANHVWLGIVIICLSGIYVSGSEFRAQRRVVEIDVR